ncbi:MAG: methionine--tRNA ligase [Alphaproteobacteria bacterium RIFCSPLOWO2_01_FULL_40_26]|nr:MAG: methionine--tRNA ligase [Alphaproteobacteria bacterium RIFCSPHIGHO2_02_FULL_40_34]OFW95524.1 MAG: methionine--tRNA ligase [Alphaproteobacteria bacterium RIFCSPLOWO2_01_FULL_40_26]OFX09636.1 MAG: methionine--tRNA ligase [Alphaproteobacteria bacterium RIFCSPLOWO2_02_FULL_40_19]OFX11349.1 MAG: methionine--tRNA ligase [Alphaproteobacteria bacterium RIFCSPLOWO2_12_FULL_40_11]
MSSKNFYITSPIYYVNDVPHIGHAYTSIACDAVARFKRLEDHNVFFLTGTDEHGQKVEKSALARGKNPREFCNEVSQKFRELAVLLNLSNDDFIRTTEERHKKCAQKFWEILEKNGWIYKDIYEGWYAVRDEAFYAKDELINGKAPSGAEVAWHKEESYFFKLSAFQEKLLTLYEAAPDFIRPQSRFNEVVSFVKSGLKDLSISRTSFSWGIPVPETTKHEARGTKHVMYVWLDALTNYLSALGFPDEKNQLYQNFWVNAADSPIHMVGKDIVRFHAVYWPAFLMAANLNIPHSIYAHGWWTNEGQKISKSVGNVIDPHKELEWLESFGCSRDTAIDYFRYFLLREVPFGNDGDYSRINFINRINSELANNIGNLAQRSLTMIWKNCGGKILTENSYQKNFFEEYFSAMKNFSFDRAIGSIIEFATLTNKNFNDAAPWNLKKEGKIDAMNEALYIAAESTRITAILLLSFAPSSANRILDLLNIQDSQRNFAALSNALKAGHRINEPKAIFPRLEPVFKFI